MSNNNENNEKLINPNFSTHGFIQVYTGDGKGKTTASLGLTMRALGRGWNVLIIMFTKGGDDYGELYSFTNLNNVLTNNLRIVQAGLDRIVYSNNISDDDAKSIKEGWEIAKTAIKSEQYQLIVLDEANIAIDLNLIDLEEMLDVLKNKPENTEIVLTGRNARQEIIDVAHLVSEIRPIKHYWDKGIQARKGIEF